MKISISPKLFRYDLDEPPVDWSTNFFSNEKNYYDPILGHKNKAGLFFFADSKDLAKRLGCIAAKRENKDMYYLTQLDAFDAHVQLINFSKNDNIFFMLCTLIDMNIDVLSNKFQTYNKLPKEQYFSDFKSIFELAEVEKDYNNKRQLLDQLKIGTLSVEDFGVFGQRLTDFDNGLAFKSLVKSLDSDIDGYVWKENTEGLTYCFFDSDKLPTKNTMVINI